MSEDEMLAKYGTIEVFFENSYKGCFTYLSNNKNLKVYGHALYRGELVSKMTIADIWQELESFYLSIDGEEVWSDE